MFDKTLEYVLKKMCEYVNVNFEEFNFEEPEWYLKHSWTFSQQEDFTNWLREEILHNKEVRQLLGFSIKPNKKVADMHTRMFVMNYGWKLNENDL